MWKLRGGGAVKLDLCHVPYRYGAYCSRDVLTSVDKATVFTVVAAELGGRRTRINY